MAISLDDAHIKVRIDVEGASRDVDKLDTRLKEKERKRKADREREEKDHQRKAGGGVDARGIGSDILHGRTPGISRFGKAGLKVAGAIGGLYAIDALIPPAIGLLTSALLPDELASKVQTAVDKAIGATIGKIIPTLEAGLAAKEDASSLQLAMAAGGRAFDPAKLAPFFAQRFRGNYAMLKAERAERNVTRSALGAILGDWMKDRVTEAFRDVTQGLMPSSGVR